MAITTRRASATTVTFSTPQEVVINHIDDSIRVGDGTDLVGTTTVGGDVGFNVNIINDGINITQDIIDDETNADKTVGTGAAVLAAVGGANRVGRFELTIQPTDGKLRYSVDSGMSNSDGGFIPKNGILVKPANDQQDYFVIAVAGTVTFHVTEAVPE